eukprot:1273763-Karenia_brevis.AAC.1
MASVYLPAAAQGTPFHGGNVCTFGRKVAEHWAAERVLGEISVASSDYTLNRGTKTCIWHNLQKRTPK